MVINTWFLSHAHRDHYRGFYRFLNKNRDSFELKNVMYTIDKERSGDNFDITGLLKLIRTTYPDVRYYKPHTGETVNIAGVEVDILYTLEDRFVPNSSKKLIIDTDNLGGTYRDGMYKDETNKTYDFNDTSTVIRVRFENGVSSILYGDLNKAAAILEAIYPSSTVLKTDIMLMPHHGHNELPNLVTNADAKVYLYTQHRGGVYGPDGDVTTVDLYGTYHSSLRNKFLSMFPAMNVAKGKTPNVDYQIFWAGYETVTIDINALASVTNAYTSKTYYTTEPAQSFEYTGWSVTDLYSDHRDQLLGLSDPVTESAVNVTSTTNRFNPVASGGLKDNSRYIIKHKETDFVMSYEAVAKTAGVINPAFSLTPNNSGTMDPSRFDQFYENEKGIYLDHSNRALAMWILNQEGTADDASLVTGPLGALFGGKAYGETWLNKGNATEYDSNGNKTAGRNGVYWHATYGEDNNSPATQYRYLDVRYNNASWLSTSVPTGTDSKDPKKRYIIEDLGSGDFLIYWRSNSGETVCFLTCDVEGNWGVKKYTADTTDDYPAVPKKGSAELESLKLKLYVYKNFTTPKSIQFSGSKTINVAKGTTLDQLNIFIQQNISLTDTARRHMPIPGSGTQAQIGSYYLKFSKTYNASSTGQYTVTVMFRNDDNTDTKITTLTVNVQ
jgi:hypothetical protein